MKIWLEVALVFAVVTLGAADPGEEDEDVTGPVRSAGGRKEIVKRYVCAQCPSCCEHKEIGRDKRSPHPEANPEARGPPPPGENGQVGTGDPVKQSGGGRKQIVKRSSVARPTPGEDEVDETQPERSGGGRKQIVKRSPDPVARPTPGEDAHEAIPPGRSGGGRKQIVKRSAREDGDEEVQPGRSGGGRKQIVKRSPDPVARPTPGEDDDVIKEYGDCGGCRMLYA